MDEAMRKLAAAAKGFMPEVEGVALHDCALAAPPGGPWVEIGSYCGKSAVYLGAAARSVGAVLYSIDHHRGSEEHQVGEEYHDKALVNPESGRIDTLPEFARTVRGAGLENVVLGIAAESAELATVWKAPVALVFIDGGHSHAAAHADYEGWSPHVVHGGLLVIHDVFEDPAAGGRPPFEIYRRALDSGSFVERRAVGSLRALERVGDPI
jgi:MMP 1-O-methyltransferase